MTPIANMTPCQLLALARQQMALLLMGRNTVVVETPQLGRVEFGKANLPDLQRLIDGLAAQCAESQGQVAARRRPFSIEAWP